MNEYNEHNIEEDIQDCNKQTFQAIWFGEGSPYSTCLACDNDLVVLGDNSVVPTILIHHRDEVSRMCEQHFVDHCEHMGPLIRWETYRSFNPLGINIQ